jgi:hypothetical protein
MRIFLRWLLLSVSICWSGVIYAQNTEATAQAPLDTLTIELADGEDKAAITIRDTSPIHLNHTGILTNRELGLPERLWEGVPAQRLDAWLQSLAGHAGSVVLRQWVLKAIIAADPSWPEDERLFERRIEALIRLGHADLALELLQDVPKGLMQPPQERLAFLLGLLNGGADDAFCGDAVAKLAKTADVFWQRWVVLCQLRDKKFEKASLGLQLLEEQNAAGDLFERLVRAAQEEKPLEYGPDDISPQAEEPLAWLLFMQQGAPLWEHETPSLALAGLLHLVDSAKVKKLWPDLQRWIAHGAAVKGPFRASLPKMLRQDGSLPELSSRLNPEETPYYFYLIAVRDALGMDVPPSWSEVLYSRGYQASYHILYPRWYQELLSVEGRSHGAVMMRLTGLFNQPLASYHPRDIGRLMALLSHDFSEGLAHAVGEELFSDLKRP